MKNEYDDLLASEPAANEYDAVVQQDGDQQRQRLRASMFPAVRTNPDEYAQAKQLGKQTGLPAPVVERNLPEVAQQTKFNEYDKLLLTSPTLAQTLQDPDFAKLSHDDIEALQAIEARTKQFGEWKAAPAPEPGIGSFFSGLGSAFVEGAKQTGLGIKLQIHDALGGYNYGMPPNEAADQVGRRDLIRQYEGSVGRQEENRPAFESGTASGLYSGLESLVQQAPGTALSLVTRSPIPALAQAGMQTEAQAYGKYTARGATSGQAFLGAAGEGATEVATELLPMSFLVKNLGKVGAGQFLTGLLAREVPTEQVATLVQDAIDTAIANPDKTWAQYVAERPEAAYQTLLATVAQAGVMEAGHVVAHQMGERANQAQVADQNAVSLQELNNLASQSKLRKRDPESFAKFVEAAAANGPVQDVYVSAQTLMQSGIDPSQLPASAKAQLDEALVSNSDIRIPLGEYSATIAGTEAGNALLPHLRTSPEGMTQAEAQTFMQSQAEEFKKEAEKILEEKQFDTAWQESAKSVEKELMTQLQQANRFTPDVNQAYASLMRDFYTTAAARLGITPEEMYVKYPLRVVAENVAGEKRMDQDRVAVDTPEFKNWFGESKVVDAQGQPQVVYHGTDKKFSSFSTKKTTQGLHWFTSDKAAVEAGEVGAQGRGHVMELYASLKNPASWAEYEKLGLGELRARGYDGAILREKDGTFTGFAFEPTQLKSATKNSGAFDLNNANIYKQSAIPSADNGPVTQLWETIAERDDAFQTPTSAAVDLAEVLNDVVPELNAQVQLVDLEVPKEGGTKPGYVISIEAPDGSQVTAAKVFDVESDRPFIEIGSERLNLGTGVGKLYQALAGWALNNDKTLRPDPRGLTPINELRRTEQMIASMLKYGESRMWEPDATQFVGLLDDNSYNAWVEQGKESPSLTAKLEALKQQYWGVVANANADYTVTQARINNMAIAGTLLAAHRAEGEFKNAVVDSQGNVRIKDEAGGVQTLDAQTGRDAAQASGSSNVGVGYSTRQRALLTAQALGWNPTKGVGALRSLGSESLQSFDTEGHPDRNARAGVQYPGLARLASSDSLKQILYQPGQGGSRGSITFPDQGLQTGSVITLLQNADLSTFLHESGHFYLQVLNDIATQPNAPADIQADMQKLLDWFGVKDAAAWNALDLEAQRPYHEQFARGFEAYLFEGKAPSIELNSLFSKFRAWLLNVYRTLKNLNVEITDEVRGVMDRMLATNEQIVAAEAARSMNPLFKSAEEAGMTTEEWKAYQELGQDATQTAVDQLQRRSLRDMQWLTNARGKVLRSLQRDAARKRKEVMREVQAEVRQQPVYAAMNFLKRGEGTVNGEEIKVEKGFRLNTEALAEMYPESMPARPNLDALQGMTAVNGLPPDTVAQMFGFTSGDHLVRSLTEAQPEKVAVEGLTDQRMLERYGDLTDPQAIERAANEAIHNDARMKFVATELRALNKAVGNRNILISAAKDFAAQIVARKKVRDIRPTQYEAAEGRAAKAAEQSKDLAEKATQKRNQLVNGYATKAAYDALDEIEKGVRYLKRFDNEGIRKAIDPDYRDQIDRMLERFDLRKGQSLAAIDKRKALAEWIKSQEEQGFEPIIDDQLRNEAFKQHYRDLTLEQFRGLVDAVKNIEHLGRLKEKLLTAVDQRAFAEARDAVVTSIEENAKRTIPEQRSSDRGLLVNVGRLFRQAAALHRKFASLVREFDGFKDGGNAWEYLVRNMNERGNFEAVENEKATMALAKLLDPVMKVGKLTQKQYFPDSGKSYTREERIGIALNMGNETNRERVLSGERLTPAQLGTVLDTLTKEDWDFVQGVWDYLDTYRPQIAAKERRLTGVEPKWVEASAVQTKYGEYKGGYYPIAYDPLLDDKASADINAEVQRQMQQGLYTRAQTARGHTKARVESTGRPLRYDFGDVISRHVTQVVHDLAWHEYLIDANRLLRSKEIQTSIRDHYGPEVHGELKEALKDIAVGNAGTERGAKFFNHLRYGATIAGLGFNVFNTLQNLTGITQSMSRIGTGWVLKGAVHWAGDAATMESSVKKIYEKSDFMRLRSKTMQREINEIRNKVSGKDSRLHAAYFWLQNKTQIMVDVPTWWGAYEKAMAQDDMSEKKAIALADQAVLDAQGGGQIKDLAGIQRGGSGLKLFTTFYSFFNTTFNNTAEAYGRTNFKKPGDVAMFTADMALLYAIPALLSTLLKAALMGDWDREDKLAKKIAGDQISYMFGTVVGLREATAAAQAVTGTGEGFGYTGPASVRFFSDLYKLGQQAHQGEADAAFWKSLNNVGGVVFHYPAGQINRTAEGIAALSEGKTENPLAVVMGSPKKH